MNCPGHTQFRYQLVFLVPFMVKKSWLKVAVGIFCLGKKCHQHLLPGGMFRLLQCHASVHKIVKFCLLSLIFSPSLSFYSINSLPSPITLPTHFSPLPYHFSSHIFPTSLFHSDFTLSLFHPSRFPCTTFDTCGIKRLSVNIVPLRKIHYRGTIISSLFSSTDYCSCNAFLTRSGRSSKDIDADFKFVTLL